MLSERINEFEQQRPTHRYWSFRLGKAFRVDFWDISLSQKKELQKELTKANKTLTSIKFFNDYSADERLWEGSKDRCEDLLNSGAFYLRTKMIRGHIGKKLFWLT